jgi:hypothetical protein
VWAVHPSGAGGGRPATTFLLTAEGVISMRVARAIAPAVVAVLGVAGPVFVQTAFSFDGPLEPFSGRIAVVRQPGGHQLAEVNVAPGIQTVWTSLRPIVADKISKEVGSRRFGGQGAYEINVGLAERGSMFVGVSPERFVYVLPGNSIRFKMTTPGPLGSYADPKFHVDFDAKIEIGLDTLKAPRALSIQAVVTNFHIRGANVTGTVGLAVNDVIHFLGGSDLKARLASEIEGKSVGLVIPVNEVMKQLNVAIPPGASLRPVIDKTMQRLVLEVRS